MKSNLSKQIWHYETLFTENCGQICGVVHFSRSGSQRYQTKFGKFIDQNRGIKIEGSQAIYKIQKENVFNSLQKRRMK